VVVCPGYSHVTLGADKVFIPQKMVSATIAEPGEKKTNEVVPQIVKVTHAAMLNYFIKDKNNKRIQYAL
jgi:phosphoribosyl-dephospho-CoA transferase